MGPQPLKDPRPIRVVGFWETFQLIHIVVACISCEISSAKNEIVCRASCILSATHWLKNALCLSNERNGGCTSTFSVTPVSQGLAEHTCTPPSPTSLSTSWDRDVLPQPGSILTNIPAQSSPSPVGSSDEESKRNSSTDFRGMTNFCPFLLIF